MKKIIFISIIILLVSAPVFCEESQENAGQYMLGDFLRLNWDARSAGMAGSGVGDPMTIGGAMFHNPSGLGLINKNQLYASGWVLPLPDMQLSYLAFSKSFGIPTAIALSVLHLQTGEQEMRDEYGLTLGTFENTYNAVCFGFGTETGGGFHIGFKLNYVDTSLAHKYRYTFLGDLGALYTIKRVSIGFSANQIGLTKPMNFLEKDIKSSPSFRMGVTVMAIETDELRWTFNFDNVFQANSALKLTGGSEFSIMEGIAFRAGMQFVGYDIKSFSSGFGLNFSSEIGIDYAFNNRGPLGDLHIFSLQYNFGAKGVDTSEIDKLQKELEEQRRLAALEEEKRRKAAMDDAAKQAELLAQQKKELEDAARKAAEDEARRLAEAQKLAMEDKNIQIKEDKRGIVINLAGITFAVNSSVVPSSYYPTLDKAANIIAQYPGVNIRVEGHTDSSGSDAYNQKLSERRADSVKLYFIQKHGIPHDRISSVGFGETTPIVSNATPAGRSQNRRVEIILLTTESGSKETPVPEVVPTGTSVVYCGSYTSPEEASSEISKLKSYGYSPVLVKVTIPDKGVIYRVKIGSYDKQTAESINTKLRTLGFNSWIQY